jgi:hypothetical protein
VFSSANLKIPWIIDSLFAAQRRAIWSLELAWSVVAASAAREIFWPVVLLVQIIRVYLRSFAVPHTRLRCPCMPCGMGTFMAIQRDR